VTPECGRCSHLGPTRLGRSRRDTFIVVIAPAVSIRTSEIEHAARAVITTAFRLQRAERFCVITDKKSSRIGIALAAEADRVGATIGIVDLDHCGLRPLKALPDWVVGEIQSANASAFVAHSPHAELSMRQQLLHAVGQSGVRHAHMPGISQLGFAHGLRMDYARVAKLGGRLLEKVERARRLEVQSSAGTELYIELRESCRWFAQLGTLEPGRWGNLPAGALYASPHSVDGTLVVNASLGEWFGAREGSLLDTPVTLEIRDSRVTGVKAPHSQRLVDEIQGVLSLSENSDRIGLVALGVNSGITEPTGEALVDQNMPGLHLCVGDPAAQVTGANWSARTSFAACQSGSTVLVDGAIVLNRGRMLTPT
jgi:leucyl aminopeptidase (aminopeptidase T)